MSIEARGSRHFFYGSGLNRHDVGYGPRIDTGGQDMALILSAVLTVATAVGAAYLGHFFLLAHAHFFGVFPIGALLVGATASIGVVLAIRLTSSYDTPGFRVLGQFAGVVAFSGAMLLDYATPIGVARGAFSHLGFGGYLVAVIDQEAKALVAFLPAFMQMPPWLNEWAGVVQLILEAVVASVTTGWMISFFADVPFCFSHHRFYDLKTIMESKDLAGLHEWERAIGETRPMEARSIFTKVRSAGIGDSSQWTRVVVHQCPVCLKSRVRIETRHRVFGFSVTGLGRDLVLDSRGSAAVPD